ncbi:SE-cephalotoxin-like [Neolamprologus brichardi]|uniref:EGF-like domain-containing protein n=1 Tax=Neolamprologus brichardi TaxID=32507 RepID=A0A3Q4HUU2_NEOBR|nr:SE-cephalotoxin-like [Neolamprologus brichardi]
MASRWWPASMLLASLLFLYWTTSSARPRDPVTADLSPPYRARRDLPEDSRDRADQVLNVVKDSLSLFKDVMENINPDKVVGVIKSLSNFASLAPGIGGVASSVISTVLVFIPQDDPVLKAVKEGFAEVNRKMDSLSIQISDLTRDVEWFGYISVYSQDELRILNAWRKFNEFRESGKLMRDEDKQRLAQIFTNYYENTGAETGMTNFYHYLTVTSTSLSGNINELLKRKFKCDTSQIGKYNLYLSSLLWKGMLVNQFYWKLLGLNTAAKEAEHTQMFKKVSEAQISAVQFCLTNYEQFMKNDVIETAKAHSANNKQAIAVQVKTVLDRKYNWYSWVVVVYDTDTNTDYVFYNMTKIPVDSVTVAVGYTLKEDQDTKAAAVVKELDSCHPELNYFHMIDCDQLAQNILNCNREVDGVSVGQFFKVMHRIQFVSEDLVEVPAAMKSYRCSRSALYPSFSFPFLDLNDFSQICIHYSRSLAVCNPDTCLNGGQCKRLLDSNQHLCDCPDSYLGDRCEHKMNTTVPPIDVGFTVMRAQPSPPN